MKWPQIVMIVLYVVSMVDEAKKHGEPRTGKHNFYPALIGSALGIWVLWAGGFWK